MMYRKAVCFGDTDIAVKILDTRNVSYIKELGRLVNGYDDNYWSGIRQIVVYQGLWEKFRQNLLGYALMMVRENIGTM